MNYKPSQLLFIDATVNDIETLLQGALPGIEAHILSGEQDGVVQITQILQHRPEVNTVHIVSHGAPGCLYLGNSQLNLDTLKNYTSQLQGCSRENLNLLLYGCNVAAGDAGEEFLYKLRSLTDAKIAASATKTGNAALEGDWDLEVTLGEITPKLAFSHQEIANYAGILAPTVPFDVSSAFNVDAIVNRTGGVTDTTQTAVDATNRALITQSFATFANSTLGNGLPDNGLFSATNFHPDIQLSYRNSDNGYNAHLIKTSTGSFTFNVSGQYAYVHLGLTSTEGSSNVDLTLNYSDGTTKTTNSQTIPDWYNEITESKTLYYLINDLDLSNADATGFNNANDPAIFGVRFSANAAKTLQSITVEKTASTGYLVFLGATGELNTAPTLNTPTVISYTDTPNDDTFTAQTGTLAASDPDSEQTLTYGIDGGTVNGTTVNKIGTYGTLSLDTSTGAYTFTPVDSAIEALTSNATEGFNVTVSDGTAIDSKTLNINLTGVNDTPTLNTPIAINYTDTANDDTFAAQTGTLAANDRDSGQTLTYGITSGTVNGTTVTKIGAYGTLSLDTTTGAYTFTPDDSGIEALTSNVTEGFPVTVSDGTATDNKTLDINLIGVNDAPILQNAIADQIAQQDTAFSFTFDANTFNDVDAGDNLTYSATLQDGSNLPNWLKFNATTRTFSGTPTNADVVNLTIELQAKDNDGVSATDTFALAVEPNNGTPTLKLSKIADDIFKISNSSSKSKLQVTLTGQSSNLVNELGVFTVDDAQGNINGIAPGAAGYAQAALDRAKVIFSAIANLPNGFNTDNLIHLLEFNSDDNFRFYLVKNSTTDAVRTGVTPLTDILFSDPLTQKITDLGNDDFSLAWKDGGNNTADFNNLVVKIQSTNDSLPLGTNLQGNSQGEVIDLRGVTNQVKADFVVNREADFKNFIGFYQVADENGGIDTNGDGKADILTGQAGYTEAAVRGRVAGIDLTVNNQGSATFTGTFQPGSIFVPFIISNGTPDALLDSNPNNDPAVYFPFLGANTDKVDHIRLLGNNVFGFEDLASGGDKDFNDMIVRVNLTIA
ncbi:MAG: DUF4347 domain-containing protein [Nostoc sp.]|uniref:DUF4347 domain-containing protein n=1 Tax=Nostoc sp. TaxID=1180 RepID=UPI002FFB7FCF